MFLLKQRRSIEQEHTNNFELNESQNFKFKIFCLDLQKERNAKFYMMPVVHMKT